MKNLGITLILLAFAGWSCKVEESAGTAKPPKTDSVVGLQPFMRQYIVANGTQRDATKKIFQFTASELQSGFQVWSAGGIELDASNTTFTQWIDQNGNPHLDGKQVNKKKLLEDREKGVIARWSQPYLYVNYSEHGIVGERVLRYRAYSDGKFYFDPEGKVVVFDADSFAYNPVLSKRTYLLFRPFGSFEVINEVEHLSGASVKGGIIQQGSNQSPDDVFGQPDYGPGNNNPNSQRNGQNGSHNDSQPQNNTQPSNSLPPGLKPKGQ